MWLGSRLLPATSASIGVNSSALVSLTREMETDGSFCQLLFQTLRRFHSGESAAENQDAFLRCRSSRLGSGFGAEQRAQRRRSTSASADPSVTP